MGISKKQIKYLKYDESNTVVFLYVMICSEYLLTSWLICLGLILLYQVTYIRSIIQNYLIKHKRQQIFHVYSVEGICRKGARCGWWLRSWRDMFLLHSVTIRALQTTSYQPGWISLAFCAFFYIYHPYSFVFAWVGSWILFLCFVFSSLTCLEMFLLEGDLLI